ncbi:MULTISPECIES: hypothetical protein [Streptomyces]|uniref:hypothetical protein n=1 Tax=Streptomyces TaxID=1883 RepID=UPI00345C46C9
MRHTRRLVLLTAALTTWAGVATAPAASGAAAEAHRPRIQRVSVAADGTQAGNTSYDPAISGDGRTVAFISRANNLTPGAGHAYNLYLKDLRTGAIERANVAGDGNPDVRWVYAYSLSATGRYVAFASAAEQMGPGHVVDTHIYVRDRETGRTEPLLGDENQHGGAGTPAISGDGRYVAFASDRTDLVPGGGERRHDVYVRDRWTRTTRRVSVASDGSRADGLSLRPVISADGNTIGFLSTADNLGTAGGPRPGPRETSFYVHDLRTGRTRPAAQSRDGRPAWVVDDGSISPDGRYALFASSTPGIVPGDTPAVLQCYAKDLHTGTTRLVSIAHDGSPADGDCFGAVMNADDRRVFFTSWATNIVPGGTRRNSGVFVRDLRTGYAEQLDVSAEGTRGNGLAGPVTTDFSGHRTAFESWSDNLVPADTNDTGDIFVRDLP